MYYLVALVLFGASSFANSQLQIVPQNPKAQETVRLKVDRGVIGFPTVDIRVGTSALNTYFPRATQVSMEANKITVSVQLFDNGFGDPSSPMDLPLGQLPAGNYQVELTRRLPDGSPLGSAGMASFVVAPRSASDPLWNHTDIWWAPTESGWGLNMVQHGSGIIFATWFVYGADGKATWYVVPQGSWEHPEIYRGPVYRTTGPYIGGPFNPGVVTPTLAGTARFEFSAYDSNQAFVQFIIDGVMIEKAVQRQSF